MTNLPELTDKLHNSTVLINERTESIIESETFDIGELVNLVAELMFITFVIIAIIQESERICKLIQSKQTKLLPIGKPHLN